MLFFPNGKINIGLNIVNKRSDGYHNIETVFWPVGLADVLEFIVETGKPDGKVDFSISGMPIDGAGGEDNLCIKAYRLLNEDYSLPSVQIHLHKHIPPGAGLGGGSSDAAFMLKNLNTWFDLKLNDEDLCRYASLLGSDCSFFIHNRPLFGFERGNQFREISHPHMNMEVVLINPGIHVSTAEAYAGIKPVTPAESLEKLIGLPVEEWKNRIYNDFEVPIVTKHPLIGTIKNALYEYGAVYASMSGSGSTVYALFKGKAPDLEEKFKEYFYWKGTLIA